METKMMISAVISGAVLIVGALEMIYQITVIDATAMGLKHPKLWGFLAMNGNHTSGLLLYLIGRRNYPLIDLSPDSQSEIERRKKAAGIGIIFLVIGAIGLVISIMLFFKYL